MITQENLLSSLLESEHNSSFALDSYILSHMFLNIMGGEDNLYEAAIEIPKIPQIQEWINNQELNLKYQSNGGKIEASECKWWDPDQKTFLSAVKYSVRDPYYFHLFTTQQETYESFLKLKDQFVKKEVALIYVLAATEHGYRLRPMGEGGHPLETLNYTPEVNQGYRYIIEEFSKHTPAGRLVVLNGEPGTGKTYLVRAILNEIKNSKIILIPAKYVPNLSDPDFLPAVLQECRDYVEEENSKEEGQIRLLLVAEDADEIITNREEGNIRALSGMLNLADGIMGTMANIRIITTTQLDLLHYLAELQIYWMAVIIACVIQGILYPPFASHG